MINKNKPNLLIVAGPNGAGKSTVADFLLSNRSIETYINADTIAKGMAISAVNDSDIVAGRVLLGQIKSALSRQQSFAFESTMAGAGWKKLLKRASSAGYDTTICYVAVKTVDAAVDRVRRRVSEGGHDIPEETVRRRFARSLHMFFSYYRKECDYWYFFDNSAHSACLVASKEGRISNPQIFFPDIWSWYERS